MPEIVCKWCLILCYRQYTLTLEAQGSVLQFPYGGLATNSAWCLSLPKIPLLPQDLLGYLAQTEELLIPQLGPSIKTFLFFTLGSTLI